jgi:hypothetical protein
MRKMDPIRTTASIQQQIVQRGYAWLPRASWCLAPEVETRWEDLRGDWDCLELDSYLKDGATFRRRRYGRFYWSSVSDELLPLPVEPYFQPEAENVYAGGVERAFAPLLPHTASNPFLGAMARFIFTQLPLTPEKRGQTWEVRIHQIRIVTSPQEIGEPAPEGIHQDGTDFLTLHMVRRENIAGGETTIYDLERRPLRSYTMREPLDSFVLEDPRILHGVTPVRPADVMTVGVRDLLGLDFILNPNLERP